MMRPSDSSSNQCELHTEQRSCRLWNIRLVHGPSDSPATRGEDTAHRRRVLCILHAVRLVLTQPVFVVDSFVHREQSRDQSVPSGFRP